MKPRAANDVSNASGKAKRAARQTEAVILFTVASHSFAIAASAVDEIRNTAGLKPLAHSPLGQARLARVRHQLLREGKTYFVVDANFHFGLLPSPHTRVLVLRNSAVAILVDGIDRMAEVPAIYALPRAFTGDERRWYRGLALMSVSGRGIPDDVVPVINPDAFLSAAELQLLQGFDKSVKTAGKGAASA